MSFLTATTLMYAIGAGITAAAVTRLALQLFLVKGLIIIALIPTARPKYPFLNQRFYYTYHQARDLRSYGTEKTSPRTDLVSRFQTAFSRFCFVWAAQHKNGKKRSGNARLD